MTEPDVERSRHFLIAAGTLSLLGILLHAFPLLSIASVMAASVCLAQVRLRYFVRQVWVRRIAPAFPYLCAIGLPLENGSFSPWLLVLACVPAFITHTARFRSVRIMFHPAILAGFKRERFGSRWAESVTYLGPAVLQELLFRGYLITALNTMDVSPAVVVVISAAAFVVDHLFTASAHVRPTMVNLATWAFSGTVWALVLLFGGAVWITMIGHGLMNAPSAVMPHLRGQKVRTLEEK